MKHNIFTLFLSAVLTVGMALSVPKLCYAAKTVEHQTAVSIEPDSSSFQAAGTIEPDHLPGQAAGSGEAAVPSQVGEANMIPVEGDQVKNGVYSVEVESSSSMFRIVNAELTVQDGNMNAVITLSGKGYLKLFMGTGEEAVEAQDTEYIGYIEDAEGRYTYMMPVAALNKELDCAAFSKKKEKWYDRKILFDAASLPADALLVELPSKDTKENTVTDDSQESAEESKDSQSLETSVLEAPIPVAVELEDGEYQVDVVLSGGSKRAFVESPAIMRVRDGKAQAVITWSSSNYDYMKIDGTKYYPVNTEGNSSFEIPITAFDQEMAVIGDTTAMSEPHEIEYTLTFSLDSVKTADKSSMPVVLLILAVALALAVAGGMFLYRRKKQ